MSGINSTSTSFELSYVSSQQIKQAAQLLSLNEMVLGEEGFNVTRLRLMLTLVCILLLVYCICYLFNHPQKISFSCQDVPHLGCLPGNHVSAQNLSKHLLTVNTSALFK